MGEHVRDLLASERPSPGPPSAPAPSHRVLACVGDARSGAGLLAVARALSGSDAEVRVDALSLRSPEAATPELDTAGDSSPSIAPMSFPSSDPARDICRMAAVKGSDLVLLARRLPPGATLLGRTSARVMADCTCAVALLVSSAHVRTRDVLVVASGGSDDAAAHLLGERFLAGGARVTEDVGDPASVLLERRGFDLVVAGMPGDREADALVRAWQGCGHGVALLLVRGARPGALA
jgi:hypothetical protein